MVEAAARGKSFDDLGSNAVGRLGDVDEEVHLKNYSPNSDME